MKIRILTKVLSAICAVIVSTSCGIVSVGAQSELTKEQQESMDEQLAIALQLEELGMSPESIIEAEMQKEGQAKELAAIAQTDLYSNLAKISSANSNSDGEGIHKGNVAKPKLLENYKEYHDSVYRQKIESENYTDQERQTVEKFLKTAVDNCDFSMNTPMVLIEKIIDEDKIISSVENRWNDVKNSPYDENNLNRRWASPEIFHVDINKLEGKDYEKYGYLTSKDKNSHDFKNGAIQMSEDYGNVIINLKKDNLINRTTLTVGDSLNNRHKLGKNSVTPTMANDPKLVCVPGYSKGLVNLLTNSINRGDLLSKNPNSISKIKYPNIDLEYFELQFHGELRFKRDVESVDIIRTLNDSQDEKDRQEQIAEKIKKLGIPVNIIDCSK